MAKIDSSLLPKKEEDRKVGKLSYFFMWIGDGINIGNMSLGASLIAVGVATMNIYQTFTAALISIFIISIIFTLNDRIGYKTGIPYVIQLRASFGSKGAILSSLLRGIPAIVWYGFQSWLGASALNQIINVFSQGAFNNIFICFLIMQAVQIVLSIYGFHAIKWVEIIISVVVISALIYLFIILLQEHHLTKIKETWIDSEGTWGLPFFGFIIMFLGNYAAIFLSAADYSRELTPNISSLKRGILYFSSILIAYGFVLTLGTMLASASGNNNPVKAFAIIVDNNYITVAVSAFIVLGTIAVNMVANIIPPTYVITLFTKIKYKYAVVITGLLAIAVCPWVLVTDESAEGLKIFILIYSAFLGPIVSILLIEYYILRRQQIDIKQLYDPKGPFSGLNYAAIIALFIGALSAFIVVDLAWLIGFLVSGISYYFLMKYTFLNSSFRKSICFNRSTK